MRAPTPVVRCFVSSYVSDHSARHPRRSRGGLVPVLGSGVLHRRPLTPSRLPSRIVDGRSGTPDPSKPCLPGVSARDENDLHSPGISSRYRVGPDPCDTPETLTGKPSLPSPLSMVGGCQHGPWTRVLSPCRNTRGFCPSFGPGRPSTIPDTLHPFTSQHLLSSVREKRDGTGRDSVPRPVGDVRGLRRVGTTHPLNLSEFRPGYCRSGTPSGSSGLSRGSLVTNVTRSSVQDPRVEEFSFALDAPPPSRPTPRPRPHATQV